MTELAYMTREDWGQHGRAMVPQSATIRAWVGAPPYLFAVSDAEEFHHGHHDAGRETAKYLATGEFNHRILETRSLDELVDGREINERRVVVLHPFGVQELESIRRVVDADLVGRVFVMVWSRSDMVRTWLDGVRALNLHTQKRAPAQDPLLIAAASLIRKDDYNGLSRGRGKDAVVQLVRALAADGYPVEPEPWLRAYLAVGGRFRHASSVEKLVREMRAGTKHRVSPRYRASILNILRRQLDEDSGAAGQEASGA